MVGGACDLYLYYEDENGIAINLTGYTVRSDWKYSKSEGAADVIANGTVTNGPGGEVHYYVSPAVIKALTSKTLYYDIFLIPPAGGDPAPYAYGKILLIAAVTSIP